MGCLDDTTAAAIEAAERAAIRRERRYRPLKRALDLACALAALPLAVPVMVLLAWAIRLDSAGPVLFRQRRLGWRGRPFTLYKFRTMRAQSPPYAPHPESPADARVTRVGRLLRRTNLDELPQLFNVLRNDMSLVGPRPEMAHIVAGYGPEERLRLLAKPGLTGLWQISGHRGRPIHEHMEHDLAYLKTMGLWRDIAIMVRTLPLLVRGDKVDNAEMKGGPND